MAKKRERIFALVGAVVFFVTSFGLTFLVLWTMHQQSRQDKSNSAKITPQVLGTCKKASVPGNIVNVKQGAKMQGTKLVDFTPCLVDTLQTIDVQVGTGAAAQATDTVTVDYTGAVTSTGVIFQSSLDTGKPVTFPLNQVIKGWSDGIPGMKVGGKRRLLIPAAEAYGATPPQGSGIPVNADLVFDVTLIKIGS